LKRRGRSSSTRKHGRLVSQALREERSPEHAFFEESLGELPQARRASTRAISAESRRSPSIRAQPGVAAVEDVELDAAVEAPPAVGENEP